MNLHTDIPTRAQIDRLMTSRDRASVSIYLETDPASSGEAESIELKNLAAEAAKRLAAVGLEPSDVSAIEDELHELVDDASFWRYQARSLAVFATPGSLVSFRLPNRLSSLLVVSDRFHLKPLLRSVTFPQVAFVLALAQGSVRLLELGPELGVSVVDVPDLPSDVASAVGKASIKDRSPARRLQGGEGQKVRMRQYARQIDQAVRPVLGGLEVPLILAATRPLDDIYRSVNSYPRLAEATLTGNPETTSDGDLAAAARLVLDEIYAGELRAVRDLFEQRASQGRTALDLVDVARAATFGAVDTVILDIDEVVPGSIDEESGAVTLGSPDEPVGYGVVDEIARRVWLAGGRVLAVRRDEVPDRRPVAAILRYAV